MNLNQLSIIRFIGKNAETKSLPNGTPVTKFSVATKHSWKDENDTWQQKTQWHNVVPACPLWISPNPAKEVKRPGVKPKPKELYTQEEVIQILLACHKLGQTSYESDRARAIILLLRYTGLRISEVATLARDRVREDRIYLYRMKNGKPVFLPIPAFLREALDSLPTPKGQLGNRSSSSGVATAQLGHSSAA
jgi:integrase